MYTIKLHDGTMLVNLELNGNNFISDTIIPDTVFENNLKLIEISDGETTQTLTDQFLAANRVIDNKSWFVLIDKTPEMKREESMTDLQLALVELYESLLGGA
jgi:hypothetical protein